MIVISRILITPLLALLAMCPWAAAEAPRVAASITPIHSLVSNVMGEIGAPQLLIRGLASPHSYQLRPSDAAALAEADLIVWIGPGLENALARPLLALAGEAEILTLSQSNELVRWPIRRGGVWGQAHDHGQEDDTSVPQTMLDQHMWLSPDNAVIMVRLVAETLGRIDAANGADYQANADRTIQRLRDMADNMRRQLSPIQGKPYLVMHDAFQYFEKYFGLSAIGAVSLGPDRLPGARRLSELRSALQQSGAECAFAEPQIASTLLDTLVQGTDVKRGVLDPIGASVEPGPSAYFEMMRNNASAMATCLSGIP